MGSLYRRGKTWWVQYSFRGRLYRESSRSQVRIDAVRLLRMRQAEMSSGRLAAPDAEKVTFDDLVALIRADYVQKQNRTWDRVEHALKHLRPVFERMPAVAISYGDVSRYITARLDAGAARGTVHHEVAALGRMLKLAVLAGLLHVRVPLPVLKLDNVRKGFFTDDEARRVLKHLPDWYALPIEFAWRTGWRIGEVKALTWAQVDFAAGTVRLEPGTTKNREGRIFPFAASPMLAALLRKQLARTQAWQHEHGQVIPWVFWRLGAQLGDHRDTWMRACRLAGLPGRLVHDLRRSAVRNLERAGVPRSAAMKLTGHLTESVYRRYAIVSEADLNDAVRRLVAYQQGTPASTSTGGGTSTVPAQIRSLAGSGEDCADAALECVARRTQRAASRSGSRPFAADRPATVPLDHAHWKLNPPSRPSTSSTSPHKKSPGATRDSNVDGFTSLSVTPPAVTSAFSYPSVPFTCRSRSSRMLNNLSRRIFAT